MDDQTNIKLQCLFCKSTNFVVPDQNYTPKPGEQIQCGNCGRTNDYGSLMRVAKRKGVEWGEKQAQKVIDEFTKKMGKMFK